MEVQTGTVDGFTAAPPPRSKVHFVYETLREAILSGRLKPGEELVQSRLAKTLQVSSIPVMAAMRQLISEGLVTQVPHHPPRVAPFSQEGLEEMTLIRMQLEVLATATSVPHVETEGLRALRGLVDQMDAALAAHDLPRYGALNKAFHLTIYEACPYRLLVHKIKELWDHTDRHGLRSMFTPELAEASQQDHRRLLDYIEAGAAEEAGELTERQKRRFRAAAFIAADAAGRRAREASPTRG